MATRANDLTRLLEESTVGFAGVLASLADDTLAFGGDDPKALGAARRWAQAAADLAPDRREALLALARVAAQQDDAATAERALRRVLEHEPNDAEALHELGMLFEDRADRAAARRLYERAVRGLRPARDGWAALAYLSLAEIDLAEGRRGRALRHARAGIRRLRPYRCDVDVLDDFINRVEATAR